MSTTELCGYRDACFAFCWDIHAAVCFQPYRITPLAPTSISPFPTHLLDEFQQLVRFLEPFEHLVDLQHHEHAFVDDALLHDVAPVLVNRRKASPFLRHLCHDVRRAARRANRCFYWCIKIPIFPFPALILGRLSFCFEFCSGVRTT